MISVAPTGLVNTVILPSVGYASLTHVYTLSRLRRLYGDVKTCGQSRFPALGTKNSPKCIRGIIPHYLTGTVTVSDSQAGGKYVLAEGAVGFCKTLAVAVKGGANLGTISAGDELKNGEYYSYTFAEDSGKLVFTVFQVISGLEIDTEYNVGFGVTVDSVVVNNKGNLEVTSGGTANATTVNWGAK